MPIPRPASTIELSTPASPTIVFRVIGSSAYRTRANKTLVVPRPRGAIRIPSRAMDGIVRNADVVVVARLDGRECR